MERVTKRGAAELRTNRTGLADESRPNRSDRTLFRRGRPTVAVRRGQKNVRIRFVLDKGRERFPAGRSIASRLWASATREPRSVRVPVFRNARIR